MAQTTVKSEQIATNAISGTIIADNAITGVHIAQNAILTQHIDDGQVNTDQLAADAVTGAKLADSSVVTANIQDDQVTSDKLANNITIAGTLASTGVLTANAGVVVDNITIDGRDIDLYSGDLTLDVAGDIILDADGGDIWFKDGGTAIGQFRHASSSFIIKSNVTDNDLILRGDDGGSAIDALTFDMSDAGKATFNSGVVTGGPLTLGDYIEKTSGNLTIDVAGDIILDADGGDFYVKDGGTTLLHLDQYYRLGLGGDAVAKLDIHYDSGGFDDSDANSRLASSMMHFQGDNDMRLIFTENGSTFRGMLGYEHAGSSYMGIWDSGSSSTPSLVSQGGKIGIGTTSPSAMLHLYKATGSGALEPELIIENNHNTSSVTDGAGRLTFYSDDSNNSGIPDLAWLGQVRFMGDDKDGSAQEFEYAYMVGLARDPGSGSTRKGGLSFYTRDGNSVTETMTITESKVGVGTTSPSHKVEVSDGAVASKYDADHHVTIRGLSGGQYIQYSSGNALSFVAVDTYPNSSASTKMTITTGGELLVGSTSELSPNSRVFINANSNSTNPALNLKAATTTSSGSVLIFFAGDNDEVGAVSMSNLEQGTGVTYGGSSDYRLKENVSYSWDATTRLKQLKPARFSWKKDSNSTMQDGFLAHEVSSIVPEAVIGDKDGMQPIRYKEGDNIPSGKEIGDETGSYSTTEIKSQMLDPAKLVPLLVKTIQELEARITTLEG